jgi:hypothetical protein
MSLYNVVDSRKNEFNNRCDAIFEIWDKDDIGGNADTTEWIDNTTVYSAVMKAMELDGHVTLYLYAQGFIKLEFPTLSYIHPRIKKEPFCPNRLKDHLKPF